MNTNLHQDVKVLLNAWQQTKEYWRDGKSQEFERKYLEMLPEHATQALTAMEQIDQLLKKIRSDCE